MRKGKAARMKTERLTILVTPAQKAAIARRARSLNLSASEVVRRAVESYKRGGEDAAILSALASDLYQAARGARQAMKAAMDEVNATLNYFAAKRSPKRGAA